MNVSLLPISLANELLSGVHYIAGCMKDDEHGYFPYFGELSDDYGMWCDGVGVMISSIGDTYPVELNYNLVWDGGWIEPKLECEIDGWMDDV